MKRFLAAFLVLMMLIPGALAQDEVTVFPESGSPEFYEPFSEVVITTDTTYISPNLSISIEGYRYDKCDIWVADVKVRSLDDFCRSYGKNKWGSTAITLKNHAAQSNAVLAISGDSSAVFHNGLAVGNGVVWKASANRVRDLGVLWKDGTMEVLKGSALQSAYDRKDEIWETFLFGPSLLDEDGKALDKKTMTKSEVKQRNPRSVVGYYEPGHYCLVVADGRKTQSKLEKGAYNRGIDLYSLAAFMEELGCKAAYNLDGGQTAVMWFNGSVVSTPYRGGRRIGDALVVVDRGTAPDSEKEDTQ